MTLPPVGSWGAVGASERAKQLMQQSRSSFFVRSWKVFDGERGLNVPYRGASPRAEPGAAPVPQFSIGDVLEPALLG